MPSSQPPLAPPAGLAQRLDEVRTRIDACALAQGRDPGQVRLLAVSKTQPAAVVAQAAQLGQRRFGENYVQEAIAKMDALAGLGLREPIEWHFIGPIQSNKTRPIAERFDWVQSVERLTVAQRLNAQRPSHLERLNVLIEVNVAGEDTKSGVPARDVSELAHALLDLPRLRLRGLMAIPRPTTDPDEQRAQFDQVRDLAESLRVLSADIDTVSMGMSGDFEAAIAAGSTLVRIGTAIFGERS